MIVYLATKAEFREDVFGNAIADKVKEALQLSLNRSVSPNEYRSWENSLRCMGSVLEDTEIPHDTGVAIEFNVPNTGKRIDFILTGRQEDERSVAVIVELKQWEDVEATPLDAIVSTYVGGAHREVSHPSYQAWSYAMLLEDFNETVREDDIQLKPCAYLHNCRSGEVINAPHYSTHTKAAPAFLKADAAKLRDFVKKHVRHGDKGETMYRIRDGKIRPSKGLADHLASLLKGNQEFYLIDDQKVVYETAMHLAVRSSSKQKRVLIVNGGPGTGKSVVAINLLVELTKRRLNTQYVTKNSAPRDVFESKLAGTMTKSRISNLFAGSGKFTETEESFYDTLIVDEAHRLNAKSGMFSNMGENQIKEIIHSAGCSVFFLDEDQQIHWKDIGERAEILKWAEKAGAEIHELTLESQFRCNGSDGYLAWTDHSLQIRETANPTLEQCNYEFKVCDSATELREHIRERNKISNRARMVAGYCWDWVTKKISPNGYDIVFLKEGFQARWNLTKDGSLWILSPDSVEEVGCIHTCQGLEIDYVGVIVGPDLVVRKGVVETRAAARSKMDASIKGYKKLLKEDPDAALEKADRIIKNTYRTLMTRGIKGCYLYSVDPETNEYFRNASVGALEAIFETAPEDEVVPQEAATLPFPVISEEEAAESSQAAPLVNLKVAAGAFSEGQLLTDCQWVKLPDHIQVKPGFFVAQVIGESMNRKIPNGSWCLFGPPPVGSREGKIVLVQSQDIHDSEMGGHYTVKVYRSEKVVDGDEWEHRSIRLEPVSSDAGFEPIVLDPEVGADFTVIGEFLGVIG